MKSHLPLPATFEPAQNLLVSLIRITPFSLTLPTMPHPIPPTSIPASIPAVDRSTSANSGMSMTTPQPQPFSPLTMFPQITSATPCPTHLLLSKSLSKKVKSGKLIFWKSVHPLTIFTHLTPGLFSGFFAFLSIVFILGGTEVRALEVFKLCNKNPNLNPMYVSIGYRSKPGNEIAITYGDWISRGWRKIPFGSCKSWSEVAGASRVYYHVSNANYDGDKYKFCIHKHNGHRIAEDHNNDYYYDHVSGSSASSYQGLGSDYEYVDFVETKYLSSSIGTYTLTLK